MKLTNTILFMMLIAILFVSGCSKTTTPSINDTIPIYENMTDTVVDTPNDTVVVVDPVVIVSNDTVIVNDTIDDSMTNDTIVIDEPNNDNSVYSEYRDTSLIDKSIDDVESLN